MSITDKEILIAFAECNMNASETARVLIYHRNNVDYHLERIEEKTGLDPKCFFDLVKLLQNEGVIKNG